MEDVLYLVDIVIKALMVVVLTCQNKENPIKMLLLFFQSVNINIVFRHSRVANSAARDGIGPKFELIETSMDVLVTCKNEEDQNEIEGARVLTIFLPFAQGQLTQHSPSNKAKFRTHLRVKKGAICCRHMATRVLILFGP